MSGQGRPRHPARGHLSRGLLAALLLHGQLLAPLLIATFIYAAREEAQRAEEVDLGFEDVKPEELPADLPPLDTKANADETPEPQAKLPKEKLKPEREPVAEPKKREEKRDEPRKPAPKVAKETPPLPKEPPVAQPTPPNPTPPPPPPKPKMHEKIVDLDNDKEVEPPPDAKYLAQKNNRTDVETRATQTNMEREQKGAEGSQQPEGERRDDKEAGDDKAKIAQLEEEKSKLGRSAPDIIPQKETQALERPDPARPSQVSPVLSLRDAAPRGHEITPETVDPSLPHDPAGTLASARPRGAFRDEEADHKHDGSKRLKLALSGKDYEYLFGHEATADRQLAQKERSTRIGKHARAAARVRSSLENFITEVKPGNQTALNTRAAPFAAFIARMHRNIHQLWGFGALEDWDELPASSPLNDESLVTTVEIELNRDGTVSKVSMVRPSKYLPFDAAAVDVVLTAGPYPEPPREIRSGNGKVYVHWSFFRDGHQCATSGVDYFILDNGPKGGDVPGAEERSAPVPVAAAAPAGPRRLERHMGEATSRRGVAESLPGGEGESEGRGTGLSTESSGESGATSAAMALSGSAERDKETANFARRWFAAFVKGDIGAMTSRAIFPFRSAGGVAAKSAPELAQMLSNLVAEAPRRESAPVSVETAAGLRKLVGKLPPGLDDGAGALFAVTRVDGDMMILCLANTSAGWRASGLVRR
ncbi:MAG: TonB family protein [Myxococcales bacterium]